MSRPLARNLVEEASAKRQKSEQPQASPLLLPITALEKATGLVITVSDDCADHASDSGDEPLQLALSVIVGVYWLIGILNGWPVFRQEPSQTCNSEELFMYYLKGFGWYICSHLGISHQELQDDMVMVAWAPEANGRYKAAPASWHVPFWGPDPLPGVLCQDMYSWQDAQIQAMSAELALLSKDAGAGSDGYSKYAGKGGSKGAGRDGWGGKGNKGTNKSSWLNTAVPLAASIIGGDWDTARDLADEVHHVECYVGMLVGRYVGW